MATDVERLIVRLEATQRQFEKQLQAANQTANRRARQIESRFTRMNKHLSAGASRLGAQLAAAFAGAASIRAAQQLIDASVRVENALKVAGLSGAELTRVYDRLFESAQKNAAPIEALVDLYSRASLVQKELGISTEELLGFTDQVAVALRVSGKSAQESSGALLQLSQALGSGVVRAEEFNSLLEGALPIAQAAAAGIEEAGGSVAKLRQLIVEGKVSSEAFFRGFQAGSHILEERARGVSLTSDQAFSNLRNALIRAAGEFNKTTGASETLADNIQTLADIVARFDVSGMIGRLTSLRDKMAEIGNSPFFARMAELMGVDPNDIYHVAPGQGIVAGAATTPGTAGRLPNNGADTRVGAAHANDRLKPISLRDYAVKDDDDKGKKKRQDDLQREIQQITERTAAIRAMTEAQATLNPLVEDYGYTVEKAAAVQELLTAAQRAGITVTPELRVQIEQLAESYANAVVEAERLAEAQDRTRERAEELRSVAQDTLSGFINDLQSGTSAAEALLNALSRIADKLLDIALNSIFDNLFPSTARFSVNAKGNAFQGGKVIPFAKGGIVSKPTVFPMAKGMGLMGEAGPEAIMPLRRGPGGRLGVEASGSGAQQLHVTFSARVGKDGNIIPMIESVSGKAVQAGIAQYDRDILPTKISQLAGDPRRRY